MTTDKSTYIIKAQDYNDVIFKFTTLHNNGTSTIAKSLGLKFGYVNFIIDYHLSLKVNYMG